MTRSLRPPLFVCVDFQNEYAARGRPLCIDDAHALLARASRLLNLARSEGWLIAHAMVRRDDILFGRQTEHVRPLPGFEPLGDEMVFCRESFSAYGSSEFGRLLDRNRGSMTLMMSLGGPFSLLHTALDAHARRDALVLIDDVIGAPEISSCAAHRVAEATRAIVGAMHRLVASAEILKLAPSVGALVEEAHVPTGGDRERA